MEAGKDGGPNHSLCRGGVVGKARSKDNASLCARQYQLDLSSSLISS